MSFTNGIPPNYTTFDHGYKTIFGKPLICSTFTFKFITYSGEEMGCQRYFMIMPRCAKTPQKKNYFLNEILDII